MELVAGESYLIVGAAKEGNGHDYIRVRSVQSKNCSSLFIHDSTMLSVHTYVCEPCAPAGIGPLAQLNVHKE